jgi:glucose-1-phosphate adenylyltransferase
MSLQRLGELPRTTALILAGGQGERLQPLTISRPKPAVSFGGSFRIIDFTLSNCFYSGVSRVSLLTQYRCEELHRYIKHSWSERWNGNGRGPLLCLPPVSGKRYRGTADAVFRNMELLEADSSEFVLILSGDHIYQMDYRNLLSDHIEKNADVSIASVEHPLKEASDFGIVEVDDDCRVTGFSEKPANPKPLPCRPSMALVSMGVYVFTKRVLEEALRTHCESGVGYDFGHDIIPSLIVSGRTYAYDFRDESANSPRYWRDIGTIDAYYQASMDLMGPAVRFDRFANSAWPLKPAIHWSASCVKNSVVSPGIQIGEGSVVEDSVLMPGVRIGKGVRLRRAIVEEGVHVPAEMTVGFNLDHDRHRHIVTRKGVVVVAA